MPPIIYKPDPPPESIKEVLARLFTARGWGRRSARLHLERAWSEAVGVEYATKSRVLGLKRGILEVEVASGVLVQELAHYHKRRILQTLSEKLPGEKIKDLRLRVGSFESS